MPSSVAAVCREMGLKPYPMMYSIPEMAAVSHAGKKNYIVISTCQVSPLASFSWEHGAISLYAVVLI